MQKHLNDANSISKLTLNFPLLIVDDCDKLYAEKKRVVVKQLLKSGTPVGANSLKAQHAESKAHFIQKIKMAAKKAGETRYWHKLCEYSTSYPNYKSLSNKLKETQKGLNKILGTAKRKTFELSLSLFIFFNRLCVLALLYQHAAN
jgi:four helix bundle protein